MKGCLQSSWTHLITPSWNFVEVQGQSLSQSTPPWQVTLVTMLHPLLKNMLQTVCCKLQEDSGAGGFDLGAPFSWLEKPRNHMG